MTQTQLVSSIASVTGESLRTIRARGFDLVTRDTEDVNPEDLRLVLDCPFCRGPVPYPGLASDGSLPMAECLGCDVYFPFEIDEVYLEHDRIGSVLSTPRNSRFTRLLVG